VQGVEQEVGREVEQEVEREVGLAAVQEAGQAAGAGCSGDGEGSAPSHTTSRSWLSVSAVLTGMHLASAVHRCVRCDALCVVAVGHSPLLCGYCVGCKAQLPPLSERAGKLGSSRAGTM